VDQRLYEHQLFRQVRAGNMAALETLLALLEPPIRRFIRRLIGKHDAEDDIVQMVFIALYRHRDRIEPVENLRPYVFRMVRNRCYDELRRQGRYREMSLDDEPVEWRVSFTAADEQPAGTEEVAHWLLLQLEVQEAMDRLPELQRQALILYAEEGMSYAEIAEVMGTGVGTIKSRLFHAKRTLRRLLRPETLTALEEEFDRAPAGSNTNGDAALPQMYQERR
jgi:RNA polymerase sigma-70 factor (ECF subfamily)